MGERSLHAVLHAVLAVFSVLSLVLVVSELRYGL